MSDFQDTWRAGGTGRGAFILASRTATQVPLTVQLYVGQIANAFTIKNSAGTEIFYVDALGNVVYVGDETIADALTVNGNILGHGTLTIDGISTLTGAIIASSTLNVAGTSTLAGATATSLTVSGATSLNSLTVVDATVSNFLTAEDIRVNDTLAVAGHASILGGLSVHGALTSLTVLKLANGTVLVPSLTFISDETKGIYNSGANAIGISIAGVNRLDVSATAVTATLAATGKVLIEGDTTRTGTTECLDIDATIDTTTATDDVNVMTITATRAAADTGGTTGLNISVTTGAMADTQDSYGIQVTLIDSACTANTSDAIAYSAEAITADANVNEIAFLAKSGWDYGLWIYDGQLMMGKGGTAADYDCGTFTMVKGAQASDPQVQFALSADAAGDFSITADTGDITLTAADDIYFVATGNLTQFSLTAGGYVYVDGVTTVHTGTDGVLKASCSSATNNVIGTNLTSANTATTGNTAYNLYSSMTSTAVVTGTNQNLYSGYFSVSKTGADTSVNTTTVYGVYSTATNTGATDAGTKNTYAGYFTATGSTGGTATAYGIYANATGSDSVYAGYFDNRVLVTAIFDIQTTAGANTYNRWLEGAAFAMTQRGKYATDEFVWGFAAAVGNQMILSLIANVESDHDHASQTNTTLFIHSAVDPDVSNNSWGSLAHDQTNFVITTGAETGAGSVPATINNGLSIQPRGAEVVNIQGLHTSGVLANFTITGSAHTAITAATECIGANFNFSASKTWAAGAGPLAAQREVVIQAPTYIGDVAGALTMTKASTFVITNAPTAGADMAITTAYALEVTAGNSYFGGNLTVTGSLGIGDITIQDANPVLNFKDTDATAGDVNASIQADATDIGNGTEDIDVTMKQQVAGVITIFFVSDADGSMTIGLPSQAIAFNTSALSGITTLAMGGALSGVTTLGMAGDLTDYEATNDANPNIFLGSSATERLGITATYAAGTQTLQTVNFVTATASATADYGAYSFDVDGTVIAVIDDGGMEITGSVNATAGFTDGTMTIDGSGAITGVTSLAMGGALSGVTTLGMAGTLTNTLPAASKVYIDAASTVHTDTDGALDINTTTATASVSSINALTTVTATTGIANYGIYSLLTSGAVLTANDANMYGVYSSVTKSGADTSVDTVNTYSGYFTATNTGSTDAGTRKTYGVYTTATGDANGTSTTYALYATSSGADTNYAGYFNGNVSTVLAATGQVYIDANTTPHTNINGSLYIYTDSATTNVKNLRLDSSHTAVTGTDAYNLYANFTDGAVVTGTNQNMYNAYFTIAKTGLDTSVNTTAVYGVYSTASNTGSTNVGTKNTYAGYFTATGDANGTSTAYGIYATAASADTNWAGYFSGAVYGTSLTLAGALSGITTLGMAGDLTDYEAVNDGNPQILLGSSAAEQLSIQVAYVAGGQLLDYVKFATTEASATADRGKYIFAVDGSDIATIDDGGMEITGNVNATLGFTDGAMTIDGAGAITGVTSLAMGGALSGVTTLGMAGTLTNTLPADGQVYIDGASTVHTGTGGVLYFTLTSSTNNVKNTYIDMTHTATVGTNAYNLYVLTIDNAVVTGTSQSIYSGYFSVSKSGADTNANTANIYGIYSTASNTGSTDVGTKNTYAGYFTATGDTNGTATAYGIYATASGADTNWAGAFNGNVGAGAGTASLPSLSFLGDPNTGFYNTAGNILSSIDGVLALTLNATAGTTHVYRNSEKQGADVASASTIALGADGNTFELTGTTAVDLITSTSWQNGSKITLIANENVTINHATATSGANITILLAGAANFAMTANDTLTLVLSETTAGGQAWREIARTVI